MCCMNGVNAIVLGVACKEGGVLHSQHKTQGQMNGVLQLYLK